MKDTGTRAKIREQGKAELEPILDDVELYGSIAAIADQDGGKAIIKALTDDVANTLDQLAYQYETASFEQLVTRCAKLRANLTLLLTFKRAGKNRDDARKVIKETLGEIE